MRERERERERKVGQSKREGTRLEKEGVEKGVRETI